MRSIILRVIFFGFVGIVLYGCPMDSGYPKLSLRNNSDIQIVTLINLRYPDDSLKHALPDKYLEPHSQLFIGTSYGLDSEEGLTIFVFSKTYFESHWHEHAGSPDTYLDEDKILKKFYHSKHELDSLGWRIVYP